MSVGCILIIVLMVVVIVFNILAINKKRKIRSYDKRETSMDYMEAVQLPSIGARTARQFATASP